MSTPEAFLMVPMFGVGPSPSPAANWANWLAVGPMGIGASLGTIMSDSFSSWSAVFLDRRSPFSAFGTGGALTALTAFGAVIGLEAAAGLPCLALWTCDGAGMAFSAADFGAEGFDAGDFTAGGLTAGGLTAGALDTAAFPEETLAGLAGAVCLAVPPPLAGALELVDTAGRSDLA